MSVKDFVASINSLRLENKGKWYTFVGEVNGKSVSLKGFGTWLQTFNVGGVQHGGLPDIKVGAFKEALQSPF